MLLVVGGVAAWGYTEVYLPYVKRQFAVAPGAAEAPKAAEAFTSSINPALPAQTAPLSDPHGSH